jgi:Arc-like DNA binding domain
MAREDDQLKFRVPSGLRARLEKVATANKRSLNAEIIARLEASFTNEARSKAAAAKLMKIGMGSDDVEARFAEIEARLLKIEGGND